MLENVGLMLQAIFSSISLVVGPLYGSASAVSLGVLGQLGDGKCGIGGSQSLCYILVLFEQSEGLGMDSLSLSQNLWLFSILLN